MSSYGYPEQNESNKTRLEKREIVEDLRQYKRELINQLLEENSFLKNLLYSKDELIRCQEDKTVKKLLTALNEMQKALEDKGGDYMIIGEASQKLYSTFINCCNVCKKITDAQMCDQIKVNLKSLHKKIETAKRESMSQCCSRYVAPNSLALLSINTNDNADWHKSQELYEKISKFHAVEACKPKDINAAKCHFEDLIKTLKLYLESKNLCKRLEYTGSVYERCNIKGDTLEFDIMFVADGKFLRLGAPKRNGYALIKPKDDVHDFKKQLSGKGYLDPGKYRRFFYGLVQKWINTQGNLNIELREHGVASKLQVKQIGSLWYLVDLVPCFEIDGQLYVPKSLDNNLDSDAWRHSHSVEERCLLRKMDMINECRRHCIRIIKAIFKLRTNGLFNVFTSYHIKTTAFHIHNKSGVNWHDKNLGECVIFFLKEIRDCITKKRLIHKFEPSINLLQDLEDKGKMQMTGCLDSWLKNQSKFYDVIEA